jgi:hypothetical protein
MSTYHAWYLSVAAFLVVVSPGSAQAQTESSMKLIYAVWKDTTGAGHTMKHMGKSAKDLIEAYAVLIKDKDGNVEVRQRAHKTGGSATGLQASQTIDSALVRLTAPATDSVSGYAASTQSSRLSQEDLSKIVGMFDPGESALLLLSSQPAVSEIERSLGMGAQGDVEIVQLEVEQ